MNEREVYLDHAATTPIDPRVREVMLPFLDAQFGNPSSFHMKGKVVRDEIDEAREKVAKTLGARPDEIIFTSGGTESDNLAILGAARKNAAKGKHLITTRVEHQAVMESMEQLEKEGFEVTYLEVDSDGRVSAGAVAAAIRPDTILISIIFANNEIGTINPIADIGREVLKYRQANESKFPLLHSDACQALGDQELAVDSLHVDLLTINSSKIYGPKGVGALFVKRGVKLQPLQFGGSQEKRLRPGTENVTGIIGFAEAVVIADAEREASVKRLSALRDDFIARAQAAIKKTRLNGHKTERLANNVNISFMDIEGEALVLYLDSKGIYASTGSACTSATLDPSHVIIALGLPYEVAHGSIRFTLGRSTTKEDIDYVVQELPALVERLRKISPVSVDPKYYE
jgi:cysteine desulfurase